MPSATAPNPNRRSERSRHAPEPVDETWGRLWHLGARRERLVVEADAQVRQMRDLLECV
jgi:transposase